jgi:N utilization substance protein A
MAKENLMEAIGDIARDKGIPQERLVEVIQDAITAAAKRKFKDFQDIEARMNMDSGAIEVFRYKKVTEELADPENEISLAEARQLDPDAEPGDEVEYEIDNQELSRVIAQTARQLVFQKIREAERETIFEKFKDRVGEVLNGIVSRTERGRTFITFNQTEAILYGREQIPHERYAPGDHVRVVLLDVLNDPKEPSQLVISRSHPTLLTKLFEMEVPEIYDGIVEIVTAAREPGRRAKIAVISNDPDVDPVGACVGMRGSRVQAIISELRGEKIDIIKWSDDFPTYIANALAPAELTRIKIDEENKQIDAEVEPDQLSLAIGRQGQNVRLASKLTGYKINVSSTSEKSLSLEEQIRERLLASQAELSAQQSSAEGGTLTDENFAAAVAAAQATQGGEPAADASEAPAPVGEPDPGAAAALDATEPAPAPEDPGSPSETAEPVAEAQAEPAVTEPMAPAPTEPAAEAAPPEATDASAAAAPPEAEAAPPETDAAPPERPAADEAQGGGQSPDDVQDAATDAADDQEETTQT